MDSYCGLRQPRKIRCGDPRVPQLQRLAHVKEPVHPLETRVDKVECKRERREETGNSNDVITILNEALAPSRDGGWTRRLVQLPFRVSANSRATSAHAWLVPLLEAEPRARSLLRIPRGSSKRSRARLPGRNFLNNAFVHRVLGYPG